MAEMPNWIKINRVKLNNGKCCLSISIKWWAYPRLLWKEFHKNYNPYLAFRLFKKEINITFLVYPYVLWLITKAALKKRLCEVK